jgi:hypothetical protein
MTNLLLIFFLWSESYHFSFRDKLYVKYDKKADSPKYANLFYFSRIIYIACILAFLFTGYYMYSILIISASSIKLIPLIFSFKNFKLYDDVATILCLLITLYYLKDFFLSVFSLPLL